MGSESRAVFEGTVGLQLTLNKDGTWKASSRDIPLRDQPCFSDTALEQGKESTGHS